MWIITNFKTEEVWLRNQKKAAKRPGKTAKRTVRAKAKKVKTAKVKSKAKSKPKARTRSVNPAKEGPVASAIHAVDTVQETTALHNKLAGHNTFED